MSELIVHRASALPLPVPKVPITIRPGVMSDVPFLDSLQKQHSRQVGWMPTAQFEGKIKAGHVSVAWAARPCCADTGEPPVPRMEEPVGYLIGNDQYFKRDDVGIIYQMNVKPQWQRSLVAASLLKAQFERSAYGCKLYCCWCAQDIAANRFWEAMGFVPLAFRSGSRTKGKGGTPRVHIFWQKRIRSGDTTTPWWFPSQTGGGSIREDRLVLPIPPGVHWSEVMPAPLPGASEAEGPVSSEDGATADPARSLPEPKPRAKSKPVTPVVAPTPARPRLGGFHFAKPAVKTQPASRTKPAKAPRQKAKNDPKLIAAARELRDRWLEQLNDAPLLPAGKYDVSRVITQKQAEAPLLEAA